MLPTLVDQLRPQSSDEQKLDALGKLAQIVDSSFGEDAEALSEYLRVTGSIAHIVALLEHSAVAIHRTALLLIGNLSSDSVDSQAERTRQIFKSHAGFESLARHLTSSDDWTTLVYTLGAIQNTCREVSYVQLMQEAGGVNRLQELVRSGDAQLEQYARGCLQNMQQTILLKAAVSARL